MIALIACLALAQEAGRVERLARELESPDVTKVARAVSGLGAVGAEALPHLEARLAEARGRTRDYLEFAIDEIRNGRAEPRVRLKSSDRNVVEVLYDLHRQSGAIFSIENLVDDVKPPEIAVDIADASMLEALDAVCRAANVSVSIEGDQFTLYQENYAEKPRCYFGGFEHLLGSYSHQKTVDFRRPATETFGLRMLLLWNPAQGQPSIRDLRVVEAVDDLGKSLVIPPEPPGTGSSLDPVLFLPLLPPSAKAEKIKVLRGYTLVGFPRDAVEISLPILEPGRVVSSGPFQVKLLKLDRPSGTFDFEISSSLHKGEELASLPISTAVTIKGGDPARSRLVAKSVAEHGVTVSVQCQFLRVREQVLPPSDEVFPFEKIVVRVVTRQLDRRIPFEFRDVKVK